MATYVLRRALTAVPVLLGVTLFTFSMLHFVPGDPVLAMFVESGGATAEQVEAVRERLGLKEPLPVQYGRFLLRLLRGDLGRSIWGNHPVTDLILERFPLTLQLAVAAMGCAILLGTTLGVLAALHRGRLLDNLTMVVALLGVSMPSFWLGFLLIYVFAIWLGVLPVTSLPGLAGLVLPAGTLGFGAAAIIARMVRSSLVEVFQEDYVRTARAKGLRPWSVITHHALRNALIPVVTIVGLQFGGLLAGTVIVESVFARRGLGLLLLQGIQSRDFPVVQGGVLFIATVYVVVNLAVDLLYGYLDPRIRYD
ncbi:MAG: ABC transporter permease [Armatimonadota bacterium]|nr:ABC transporter permease [Armatimonadota bacterium]MDR7447925.1 ABC transporter permease [Armatimonadota bacterium]MDR7458188.1 ABC transporter permease [Armatimonadota bacterium]MDR7478506.1 ABC transporter permease [Armatimonadota bacterium]MDR7487673.1 ABC transporter permease [Armatimonadota bacterium]